MNFIDILFGIPLLWFAYKGYNKGLIVGIASLLALVGGIYLAVHFSWYVGGIIEDKLKIHNQYASLTAFSITFLGVVIFVNMLGKMITKLVNNIHLGFLNKLSGGIFGLIKVSFIISVVLFIYERLDPSMKLIPEDVRENSLLYHPVESVAPVIIPKLEEEKNRLETVLPDILQREDDVD